MAAPYVCTISIILLAFCSPPPSCLAAELMTWKCNNRTYYAPNTTYQSNVRSLVSSLAANASGSSPVGFATGTLGAGLDMVWGLALCRGDTNGTECASCLALAPGVAFNKCQGAKDVSVFYDRCLLRYSDMDFLASPDNTQVQIWGSNKASVTSGSADRFKALAAYLVGALSDLAALNTTTRYAVGVVTSDLGFPTTTSDVVHSINGLVQCTPDQAPRACRGCLQELMDQMPAVLNGSIGGGGGGGVSGVWCRLRYEVKEFYDGSPMVRLAAPSDGQRQLRRLQRKETGQGADKMQQQRLQLFSGSLLSSCPFLPCISGEMQKQTNHKHYLTPKMIMLLTRKIIMLLTRKMIMLDHFSSTCQR